jgi:hypothetical protein
MMILLKNSTQEVHCLLEMALEKQKNGDILYIKIVFGKYQSSRCGVPCVKDVEFGRYRFPGKSGEPIPGFRKIPGGGSSCFPVYQQVIRHKKTGPFRKT